MTLESDCNQLENLFSPVIRFQTKTKSDKKLQKYFLFWKNEQAFCPIPALVH
jgi:hypothetical protein